MTDLVSAVAALVGVTLILWGLAAISLPLMLIVAGLVLIRAAFVFDSSPGDA